VVGVLGATLQRDPAGWHARRVLASFSALAQLPDWVTRSRVIFGFLAGIVRATRLNPGSGPRVGDAVNQSVVITFLLLFFVNFGAHHRSIASWSGRGM